MTNTNFKPQKSVNFSILIDYAHEPESLSQFLKTLANWRESGYFDLIIHVLSCDGVGRDDWKKPIMGNLSYKYADFTVLTTDNYGENDNPQEIIELLGKDFIAKDELLTKEWLDYHLNLQFEDELKKTKKVKFLLEIDRKTAMTKSLRIAQFLASNYDYLSLKKNNLSLTKGKPHVLKAEQNLKWQTGKLQSYQSQADDENWGNSDEIQEKSQLESDKKLVKNLGKSSKFNNKITEITQKEQILNSDYEGNYEEDETDFLVEKSLEKNSKTLKNQENPVDKNNKIGKKIEKPEMQNINKLEVEIENAANKIPEKLENEETLEMQSPNKIDEKTNTNENEKMEEIENKSSEKSLEKVDEIKVLVVSTGVGCEPFLSQPGGNLTWSEKEIWQEIWEKFAKTL